MIEVNICQGSSCSCRVRCDCGVRKPLSQPMSPPSTPVEKGGYQPNTVSGCYRDDDIPEDRVSNQGRGIARLLRLDDASHGQSNGGSGHVHGQDRKHHHRADIPPLAARRPVAECHKEAEDDEGEVDVGKDRVGNFQLRDYLGHGTCQNVEGCKGVSGQQPLPHARSGETRGRTYKVVGKTKPREDERDGLVQKLDMERELPSKGVT